MIKFFRQIRQRMIKENRVSKYLLYAIGEIVLVVIGILIALQINTWNEQRKLADQETMYLERLLSENKLDIETFSMSIQNLEIGNETIVAMSAAMKNVSSPDTSLIKSVNDFMAKGSIYPVFTSSSSTFDDLSSTGNLKVIANTGLREDLVKHYAKHNETDKWIRVAVDWALPLDAPFTVENNAMAFEPHTAFLYPDRSVESMAEDLRANRLSYISNAAAHLWINMDAIEKLHELSYATSILVGKLEVELNERGK
jgi:hypothetical protein